MANKELINYIKEVKKTGHPDHVIKGHLLKHGYPEHIIDEAFESLNKKYDVAFYVMVGFIGILVILLGYYIFTSFAKLSNVGPDASCQNVSLVVRKYNDQEILCNKIGDSLKVSFLLFNEGSVKIDKVGFEYKIAGGSSKEVDETSDLGSDSGYIKAYDHDIVKSGELQKITITPIIKNKKYFSDRTVEIIDFSPCAG
jgi:hypothetical protein